MNKQPIKDKVFGNIFLLLGSNLEDRKEMLLSAAQNLENKGIIILNRSSFYQTEAWGNTDQPLFINQVLEIETNLSPEDLLKTILNTELELGRKRYQKWGPRCIDIDILYYRNKIITTPSLKVPHPEIQNRKFALVPVTEIAPDYIHPVLNLKNIQLLNNCDDNLEVIILKQP